MRLKSSVVGAAMLLALAPTFAADQNPLVMQKMDLMPLAFTQNNGQWADSVLYRAGANGATMWFTDGGVYYQFTRRIPKPDETSVGAGGRTPVFDDRFDRGQDSLETMMIKASFEGGNPNVEIVAGGVLEYKCNYFLGNDPAKWRTDVPNYEAITLRNVYDGVDLRFSGGADGKLTYQYAIAPGAAVDQIRLAYEGVAEMLPDAAGRMTAKTVWGEIAGLLASPASDADITSGEISLLSADTPAEGVAGIASVQSSLQAVTLVYSTYLGVGMNDQARGIAVDGSGCAYVTGFTSSSDFPMQNPYDGGLNGYIDAFVTKLSATGNGLVYSTYLGGGSDEYGCSIAVDDSG